MENEKRLIDANALVEDLEAAKANNGMGALVASTLIRYVKRCTTVDAVEVIRCFACEKEGTEECPMVHKDKFFGNLFAETRGTDFCSRGKRRTGDGH